MTGSEMLNGEETDIQQSPVVVEKKEGSETERALRAATKALNSANKRASEAERNAQFWHERAQPVTATKKEAVVEENPADFIEALTERGGAAIDEYIQKRGYVRQDDVDRRIAAVRNQVSVETSLAKDYPELEDAQSDFFKETARQYQELVAETPELKGNPKTMRLAAKLAQAEFDLQEDQPARKVKAKAVDPDDEEEDDEEVEDTPARREQNRVRRVNAQSVTGRRSKREADDNTLDATQKSIVANLRAAGSKITEESLIKRIQGGTRLSGRIGMAAAALRRGNR